MERRNNLKKSGFVGEFNKVHYQPMLKMYAYHMMILCLLGRNECKNIRREHFFSDNNAVMTERDWAKGLKA